MSSIINANETRKKIITISDGSASIEVKLWGKFVWNLRPRRISFGDYMRLKHSIHQAAPKSDHSTVYCCLSDVTQCSLNTQICVPFVHSTVCCCLSDVTHCSRYTLRSTARSAPETDHKVRLCHAGRCKVEVLCKIGKKTTYEHWVEFNHMINYFIQRDIYTTKGRDQFHWAATPLKPYKVGNICYMTYRYSVLYFLNLFLKHFFPHRKRQFFVKISKSGHRYRSLS